MISTPMVRVAVLAVLVLKFTLVLVVAGPLSLRVGETVAVPEHPVTVTFDRVAADSRCPTGVSCVWEGDAEMQITVSRHGHEPEVLHLHTHDTRQRSGRAAGLTFTLDSLEPQPSADRPVPVDAYHIVLAVSPN